MTIARELLVKLGFTFDKTNLDKFERSIIGFKTKATLAAGIVGGAFKKVLDYANEFSDKILDTAAIAKFSKQSIQQITALHNVLQKFGIPKESTNNLFENLSLQVKEASRGVKNAFSEIADASRGIVRRRINGEIVTAKQAFDDLVKYISTKASQDEQLRIGKNIFGFSLTETNEFLEGLKSVNYDLRETLKKEEKSIGNLDGAEQAARDFKNQLRQLNVEWVKFSDTLQKIIVPVLANVLGGLNQIIESVKELGIYGTLKTIETSAQNSILPQSRIDAMRENEQAYKATVSRIERSNIQNQNTNTINNTSSFQFTVAPSTTVEQVNSITESIKATLNSFWDEKTREVMNNNPQVE